MPPDKPSWEDAEETIVSYPAVTPSQPKPASQPTKPSPAPPDNDEGATIVWSGTPASSSSDEYRTVVADGKGQPEAVDVLAWLAISKTLSVRRGQIFALERPRNDIGRGADVSIFLNDRKVGQVHACIKFEFLPGASSREFVLYDLASTNGTFVNGQRVLGPVQLKDGDRISLGDTELVFKRL